MLTEPQSIPMEESLNFLHFSLILSSLENRI